MTTTTTFNKWTHNVRKVLGYLASLSAFLVGWISKFMWPIGEDKKALVYFAPFIAMVIAGVVFLAGQLWRQKKHEKRWIAIAVISLIVSTGMFLGYRHLVSMKTCTYDRQIIIVGSVYTSRGEAYTKQNPGISCETIVYDFAGQVDEIWTKDSINQSRFILEITYVICVALFALCLMSLGQAILLMVPAHK